MLLAWVYPHFTFRRLQPGATSHVKLAPNRQRDAFGAYCIDPDPDMQDVYAERR
jgi:hypothetical protein